MTTRSNGSSLANTRPARWRIAPFLLAAVGSLLLGLWAGLARVGWDMPGTGSSLALRHGALMVAGFVGTVISIERAVAIGRRPAFAAPALSAAAAVALLLGAPEGVAPGLATVAAALYTLNTAVLLRRHVEPALIVMIAGGAALTVAGATWWRGAGLPAVVPWWMAFLALTIAGERLEIIRFQRFSAVALFAGLAILAVLLGGAAATTWSTEIGSRAMGVALLLGPVWLVPRDIARRTVRTDGLARFAAAGALTAYAWLTVTGALLLAWGLEPGAHYDAAVHAFFTGFVFSAIIAHEPMIAPAVTGLRFPYSPLLYVPLVLLSAALVTRIAADLGGWPEARRCAGLVQVVAILVFLGLTVASATGRAPRARR